MKKILLITSLLFISCIYAQQQGLNNLRLDRSIIVNYDDENEKIAKVESTFDANGKLTLYIEYYWENFPTKKSFVPGNKIESTYDANGNRTLDIRYSWNTTTQSFVPFYKEEYTFDANGNQTLVIGYYGNTQSFVPNLKEESTFDANGNKILSIYYSWNTTTQSFVPTSKYEYTFDANGNQTLLIYYSWNNDTKSFVPIFKNEYTFDANGNQTLRIYYLWNTTKKSFGPGTTKYEYTYDSNGNRTLDISYSWNTTTQSFVISGKNESTYDANGNRILYINYGWNTETQAFVPNNKIVSSYNNGFIASKMIYKWYSDLGVYKPSFKTEYATILDTATQLNRMGVPYQYDIDFNVWNLIPGEEVKSYEYYTKTASLSTKTVENDLLSLYPNPTSQLLYVSHPELNALGIQIVDLNGKQMYSGTIQKDVPLDVSTYTPGMYLVTIENKETNKKNTYKIIKK
jgi:hypothetical protein